MDLFLFYALKNCLFQLPLNVFTSSIGSVITCVIIVNYHMDYHMDVLDKFVICKLFDVFDMLATLSYDWSRPSMTLTDPDWIPGRGCADVSAVGSIAGTQAHSNLQNLERGKQCREPRRERARRDYYLIIYF